MAKKAGASKNLKEVLVNVGFVKERERCEKTENKKIELHIPNVRYISFFYEQKQKMKLRKKAA